MPFRSIDTCGGAVTNINTYAGPIDFPLNMELNPNTYYSFDAININDELLRSMCNMDVALLSNAFGPLKISYRLDWVCHIISGIDWMKVTVEHAIDKKEFMVVSTLSIVEIKYSDVSGFTIAGDPSIVRVFTNAVHINNRRTLSYIDYFAHTKVTYGDDNITWRPERIKYIEEFHDSRKYSYGVADEITNSWILPLARTFREMLYCEFDSRFIRPYVHEARITKYYGHDICDECTVDIELCAMCHEYRKLMWGYCYIDIIY